MGILGIWTLFEKSFLHIIYQKGELFMNNGFCPNHMANVKVFKCLGATGPTHTLKSESRNNV